MKKTRPLGLLAAVLSLACTRAPAPGEPQQPAAAGAASTDAPATPSAPGGGAPSADGGAPSPGGGAPSAGGGAPSADGGAPSAGGGAPSAGGGAPSPDGGAAAAATAAPVAPPPPPAPSPAPLTSAAAVAAAARQPLAREQPTVIDPASSFEVEVGAHLADGRLSLHDEADAMVPSTGTAELADGVSRYRIVPDEPLRPGSRYSLRLDGAVTREPHGPDGVAYAPVVLLLKTSGERPAAPARKRRGSRR